MRYIIGSFLRRHGLEPGAGVRDPDAARRRFNAAWAEFHRVKGNADEWAKAQEAGQRATKTRALGHKSFGLMPCKAVRKRKRAETPAWKRRVRACFGPVASSPLSLQSGQPSDGVLALPSSASLDLALAPLHLHNAEVRSLVSRKAAQDKRDFENEENVRAWASQRERVSLPSMPLPDPMQLPGDDNDTTTCCLVVPPALDIGKRLLSAYEKLKKSSKHSLGHKLCEAWGARHDMLRHVDAPAFASPPEDTPSLRHCDKCYDAEWCMREGGVPELQAPLIWFIKNHTAKGRPCKTAYEQDTLVVRLIKNEQEDDQEEHFAHIGFGNLNALRFTVIRLHRESGEQLHHAHAPGTIALRCHNLQSLNAYKFVRGFDTTDWFVRWRAQLLRVDTTSGHLVPPPFRPDVLLAKPFVPDVSEPLWPLPEKLHKVIIRNLPSAPRSIQAARKPRPASDMRVPLDDAQEEEGDAVGPLADEADLWGDVADEEEEWREADAANGAGAAASGGGGGGVGGGGGGPDSAAYSFVCIRLICVGLMVRHDGTSYSYPLPRLARGEPFACLHCPIAYCCTAARCRKKTSMAHRESFTHACLFLTPAFTAASPTIHQKKQYTSVHISTHQYTSIHLQLGARPLQCEPIRSQPPPVTSQPGHQQGAAQKAACKKPQKTGPSPATSLSPAISSHTHTHTLTSSNINRNVWHMKWKG